MTFGNACVLNPSMTTKSIPLSLRSRRVSSRRFFRIAATVLCESIPTDISAPLSKKEVVSFPFSSRYSWSLKCFITATLPRFLSSGMRDRINVVFPEFALPTIWMIFIRITLARGICPGAIL